MSLIRSTVLALTAAVAVGSALASSTTSAQAWHHPHHHQWKKWNPHYKHAYWPQYRRHYYAAPVVYSSYRPVAPAPRIVSAPNPSSCLSKAYTPEGQVVFSDNCTKESAMAPVPGVQQQSEAPATQNFAGKSFQDFKNAQPQGQPQQQ